MDAIFKALNDPTRRALLDALRERDGQSLSDLEARLAMTRFGVMKHLGVLEDAGLVTTVRRGRFKHHYLNAVPLQEVIDRWLEPLIAKPAAREVVSLKAMLERNAAMLDSPGSGVFVHESFIRATPDAVWRALTDGTVTPHYYINQARLTGEIAPGARYAYVVGDRPMLSGEIVAIEPCRRLEMTFVPGWGDGAPSRTVFRVEPDGLLTHLVIEHHGLPATQGDVLHGWARIASALKTLLETGTPLATPAP